jgi:hypothetical protein
MIIPICPLIDYWGGMLDDVVKRQLKKWLPVSMELILLQVLEPMLMFE